MSSCRTPSNKVVKRLGQPRADKFVQNVGKVREVKTFPDGLAYTPKWLVAEHRGKDCEPSRLAPSKRLSINLVKYEKIHVLPSAKKIR
ncbi:MAG: hypothetical protein PWP69_1851 [Enterococcus sp.]|uniref:hypothetical protein n=1 Tax=Enterococcus sp. TaxID=35783 RepID=UPI002589B3CE|nr:hypothetical protein [Enterococcus sp.]MDK2845059.1 hypothetical protein [Enterococcus sp.]